MSNALREVSRRSLQDPRRADTPVRWRVAHIWRLSQRSRRRSGPSRNRVAADRAKARAVRYFSNRKEASSPVGPPKQSLDGAPSWVQMIAIGRAARPELSGKTTALLDVLAKVVPHLVGAAEKDLDDLGIELTTGPEFDFLLGVLDCYSGAVGTIGNHGVKGVSNRKNSGTQRDLLALQATGIA